MENIFPFKEFRPYQKDTIEKVFNSLLTINDNFILESPTGIGKSVIAYTASKMLMKEIHQELSPNVIILTSTKQLQKQYIDSFKDINDINFIWSAQNYKCNLHPKQKEDDDDKIYYGHALCLKKRCDYFDKCYYLKQKELFLNSKVGVTNYHYFFNNKKLQSHIIVCDEAHNLEKILCDQASLTFSKKQLLKFNNQLFNCGKDLNIDILFDYIEEMFDEKKNTLDIVNEYIEKYISFFSKLYSKMEKEVKILTEKTEYSKKEEKKIKSYDYVLKSLKTTLYKYSKYLKSEVEWVDTIEDKNETVVIKPLEIHEYFEILLGKRSKFKLFMSATICGHEEFSRQIGLEKYNYLETPSIIPVSNRRVFGMNNLGFSNKNKDKVFPVFVKMIDKIINYQFKKHKNINGIIHSVSYSNAEYIKNNSEFKNNIIIPKGKELLDLNNIINKSKKNLVIVSPSILEGVDLIDELSRFQIFLKVPFGFLGDVWVKTKLNKNEKWYSREAIIKLIQGSGRSIRSEKDWADTFVLDNNFVRLLHKDDDLFPKWFKDSVKVVNLQ